MSRLIKLFFVLFVLSGCAYEPVLPNKNYNFYFTEVEAEGEKEINEVIKQTFTENTKIESINNYQIFFSSKLNKNIVASNKRGDPKIYKINISLNYKLKSDNSIIFENEILKQVTFNNIDDKFELLKYEENIVENLSKRFAEDILISVATLTK